MVTSPMKTRLILCLFLGWLTVLLVVRRALPSIVGQKLWRKRGTTWTVHRRWLHFARQQHTSRRRKMRIQMPTEIIQRFLHFIFELGPR
uniref:Putative secreted protein n=1 Tax=Anopheles darlingi TaxID=43151 RepID=A0A2M4DA25_ANODA